MASILSFPYLPFPFLEPNIQTPHTCCLSKGNIGPVNRKPSWVTKRGLSQSNGCQALAYILVRMTYRDCWAQMLGSTPREWFSVGLDTAQEFAFLTSFQVMLLLSVNHTLSSKWLESYSKTRWLYCNLHRFSHFHFIIFPCFHSMVIFQIF